MENLKEAQAMTRFLNNLGELRGSFDVAGGTILYIYKGLEVELSQTELLDLYTLTKQTAEAGLQHGFLMEQQNRTIANLLTGRLLHEGAKRVEAAKAEE